MSDKVNIKVETDPKKIQNNIDNLIDETTMIQIHNLFAKIIDPWVPMDEGALSQDIEITADYVRYKQPYAHYQYIGEVYAPNIPIYDSSTGIITGWFSPPGKGSKHPTGRPLGQYGQLLDENGNVIWTFGYNTRHPLATKEWDKVAMQTEFAKFQEGGDILPHL